jgi:hypothetical protein
MKVMVAALLMASGGAASPGQTAETGIPYASRDGISEWKVVASDRIYIRSAMGDWYLARTSGPCPRMKTAMALGFDTAGTDRLDRFGAIIAEGRRCPIASLERAAEPPAGWQSKKGRRP